MGEDIEGVWKEVEDSFIYLNSDINIIWPIDKQRIAISNYQYPYSLEEKIK